LGALATWAWDGVQQPVASFDGRNKYAVSPAAGDISGEHTIVWVGKIKSTYDDSEITKGNLRIFTAFISFTDRWYLYHSNGSGDGISLFVEGNDVSGGLLGYDTPYNINDYAIIIAPLGLTNCSLFRNGVLLKDSASIPASYGIISGARTAEFTLGADQDTNEDDPSEPIIAGIIEGALNVKQVRAVTKNISDRLGLGVI